MISGPPAESPITWISSGSPNVHVSHAISARSCRPYLRRQIYLHEPIALRAIDLWTQSSRVCMVHRMPEIQTQIDGSLRSPTLLIVKPRRTELGRTRSEGSQIEGIFFFLPLSTWWLHSNTIWPHPPWRYTFTGNGPPDAKLGGHAIFRNSLWKTV